MNIIIAQAGVEELGVFRHDYDKLQGEDTMIRLFRIEEVDNAAELDLTARLRMHITTFELARSPEYVALSYEWGQDWNAATCIECDRGTHFIPRNLLLFLESLKHADSGIKQTWFWADSISINQKDHDEKSAQVSIMDQIFSKADEVRSWLGLHSRRETEALFHQCDQMSSGDIRFCELDDLGSVLGYLKSLLTLSYWERIWIVQECLLAKALRFVTWDNELRPLGVTALASLVYQINACEAEEFQSVLCADQLDALKQLPSWPGTKLLVSRHETNRLFRSPLNTIDWILSQTSRSKLSLDSLVQQFSSSKSSCQHDMVYGLLGLDNFFQATKEQLCVDYKTSPFRLMVETMAYCRSTDPLGLGRTLLRSLNVLPTSVKDRCVSPHQLWKTVFIDSYCPRFDSLLHCSAHREEFSRSPYPYTAIVVFWPSKRTFIAIEGEAPLTDDKLVAIPGLDLLLLFREMNGNIKCISSWISQDTDEDLQQAYAKIRLHDQATIQTMKFTQHQAVHEKPSGDWTGYLRVGIPALSLCQLLATRMHFQRFI